MSKVKAEDFKFFDPEELQKPFTRAEVMVDHWWLTDAEGRVACYRGSSPQCNRDKRVADIIINSFDWAEGIIQIPIAYVGRNNGFYDHRHYQEA